MYSREYLSSALLDLFKTITFSDLKEICFCCIKDDLTKQERIRRIADQREMAVELIAYHQHWPRDLTQLRTCIETHKPQIAKGLIRKVEEFNLKIDKFPEAKDVAIITVIPIEFSSARRALNITDTPETYKKDDDGRVWFLGDIFSERKRKNYSLVLTCIGEAGNASAASVTKETILKYHPRVLLLMGIAAGIRGKVKIGNVVLSERIVAYEGAALRDRGIEEPRPDMPKWFDSTKNDVTCYISAYQDTEQRIKAAFQGIGGIFPCAVSGQEEEYENHVAKTIVTRISTIASGEKLLRDPNKLEIIREKTHGKTEAGEMEAYGFAKVCQDKKVDWLVIRGISDFGDSFKDDRFHEFASKAAATVLADFLKYGLDLGD